jgi:hypothetical protein
MKPSWRQAGHDRRERGYVIALARVVGDAVSPGGAAAGAAVHEHQALARAVLGPLRPHERTAVGRPVAGDIVNVPGPQALRAVIAITPVRQRYHLGTAVLAGEALILGSPADGSAS